VILHLLDGTMLVEFALGMREQGSKTSARLGHCMPVITLAVWMVRVRDAAAFHIAAGVDGIEFEI
jgi:hypothetical protein